MLNSDAQEELLERFFDLTANEPDDEKVRIALRSEDPDKIEQWIDFYNFSGSGDRLTLFKQELKRHRRMEEEAMTGTNGKTWADLIAGIPLWLLSAAALVFVGVLIFSITLADKPYSLGFLGTFGPPAIETAPPIPSASVVGSIPSGAVIAFDLTSGCPKGWTDVGKNEHQRFAGRTLIVAGSPAERGKSSTKTRPFGDDGGEEKVTVGPVGVKPHEHVLGLVSFSQFYPGGGISAGNITSAGNIVMLPGGSAPSANQKILTREYGELESKQLNNMPPYIALYFCKKG